MAAYNYTKIRNVAISLIDRFGRTMQKRAFSESGDEWNPTRVSVDVDFTGVSVEYKASEIDGTIIMKSDKKVLSYDEITTTDYVVDDSIQYSVISVGVVNPGDTKIIYKAQVRR